MTTPHVLLAFDASSPRAVLAVGTWPPGPDPLAVDAWDEGANQTSAVLLDRVAACLARAGGSAEQVAAVACGRGPGTFTGTRVALATAQGIALGRGAPLIPLSTLAVVAASAGTRGRVLATLDARRAEVYAGTFEVDPQGSVSAVGAESCDAPELAFSTELAGDLAALAGPGADAHASLIPPEIAAAHRPGVLPSPAGLWLSARAAAKQAGDPAGVSAVYLRRSYAELGLNTPKRPVYRSPLLEAPKV